MRKNWAACMRTSFTPLRYLGISRTISIMGHMAREAVEEARKQSSLEAELQALQSRIDGLTASMDRVYADRLSGLLPEEDFQRLFNRLKLDRKLLEERRREMELQKKSPVTVDDRARELVERFIQTAGESRELLVSLIERVELTEDKEIIIKFRFTQLDEVAQSQQPQGFAPSEAAPFFTGECLH